jgi:hypothetical protein
MKNLFFSIFGCLPIFLVMESGVQAREIFFERVLRIPQIRDGSRWINDSGRDCDAIKQALTQPSLFGEAGFYISGLSALDVECKRDRTRGGRTLGFYLKVRAISVRSAGDIERLPNLDRGIVYTHEECVAAAERLRVATWQWEMPIAELIFLSNSSFFINEQQNELVAWAVRRLVPQDTSIEFACLEASGAMSERNRRLVLRAVMPEDDGN